MLCIFQDIHLRPYLFFLTLLSVLLFFPIVGYSNEVIKDFKLVVHGQPKLTETLKKLLKKERKANIAYTQIKESSRIIYYDRRFIQMLLRSQGFYSGSIKETLEKKYIHYAISTGEQYTISEIHYDFPEDFPKESVYQKTLALEQPLLAEKVLLAQYEVAEFAAQKTCYLSTKVDYQVIINDKNKTAKVHFILKNGISKVFGNIDFSGLKKVKKSYLKKFVKIETGDCFQRKKIELSRMDLMRTGLIAGIQYTLEEKQGNQVDMIFHIKERKHRTFRLGVSYNSDEDLGFSIGHDHRNIFGHGEKLELNSRTTAIGESFSSQLTWPHFLRSDQSISFKSDYELKETDAFNSEKTQYIGVVTRKLSSEVKVRLGASFEDSSVEENGSNEKFDLVSIPIGLDIDKRNHILDPTSGWVFATEFSPIYDLLNDNEQFNRWTVAYSLFSQFEQWPGSPTLAIKLAMGSYSGAALEAIPADKRFYVGGGGSVRGYPYQSLGEVDDNQSPIGGRSFGELAFEARFRLNNTWGLVTFLDGGFAYESELPRFGENFLWGLGVGVRYYAFAPIRLDIGTPLQKRKDNLNNTINDESFQFYISIGHAF